MGKDADPGRDAEIDPGIEPEVDREEDNGKDSHSSPLDVVRALEDGPDEVFDAFFPPLAFFG